MNTNTFRKDNNIYKSSVGDSKTFAIKINGLELAEQICPTSGAVKLLQMTTLRQPLPVC